MRSTLVTEKEGQPMSESSHQETEPGHGGAQSAIQSTVRSAAPAGTVVGGDSERTAGDKAPLAAEKRGPALLKNGRTGEHRSGLQRTAAAVRTVVPLLQKVLPLLEGNVVSAAANLLAPGLMAPTIDLAPLDASLAKLRGELAAMEVRHAEHDRAFKRMDEQLETMKDAIERNAHEQQQAAEELSRIRGRLAVVSVIGLGLLLVSIGVNTALFLYVKGQIH
jgi:hypothetical protein